MDANQFFFIANPSGSVLGAIAPVTNQSVEPVSGTEFLEFFNSQLLARGRQDFAAPLLDRVDLQLVPLSSKINLITADAPLPDIASLASFARSQGLAEDAVRTLFGSQVSESAGNPTVQTHVDSRMSQCFSTALPSVPVLCLDPGIKSLMSQMSATLETPSTLTKQDASLTDSPGLPPDYGASVSSTQCEDLASAMQIFAQPTVIAPTETGPIKCVDVRTASSNLSDRELPPIGTLIAHAAWNVQYSGEAKSDVSSNLLETPSESLLSDSNPDEINGSSKAGEPKSILSGAQNTDSGNIEFQFVRVAGMDYRPIQPGHTSISGTVATGARILEPTLAELDSPKRVEPLITSLVVPGLTPVKLPMRMIGASMLSETNSPRPDEEPLVVMGIQIQVKSQEMTRRLSQMSGNSQNANWSAVLTTASSADLATLRTETPWESLSIDVPPDFSLSELDEATSSISDVGGRATNVESFNGEIPGSTLKGQFPGSLIDPLTGSTAAQRNAQYQQLADRVGQAIGERLVSQINRGDWKLQLRLRPETLGRIDVALAMHSGTLDATFASDSSVTRDLILQGANRLKDTLSQSGMAVANVWVGGGQDGNYDGNPTPGRSFKDAAVITRKVDSDVVLSANSLSNTSNTSDGLDVLA